LVIHSKVPGLGAVAGGAWKAISGKLAKKGIFDRTKMEDYNK
jgi:hypothetical protein